MSDPQRPERFSEPWSTTLLRTVGLALLVGLGVGLSQRRLAVVPLVTVLALWFTLGGHFVELFCRNDLRPRFGRPALAFAVRLGAWFVGGSALYGGALLTNALLTGHGSVRWPWWTGGVFLVAAELVIHLLLLARRQPSAFDGRA